MVNISEVQNQPYLLKITPDHILNDVPILLLHGFPAEPITSNETEKNIDLAILIATEKKRVVYLLHYPGLGKNEITGSFSFIDAIEVSIDVSKKIVDEHGSLALICHSFGAFVGASVVNFLSTNVDQIIFLSPFLKIPNRDHLSDLLFYVFKDVPYLLMCKSYAEYLNEFDILRDKYSFFKNNRILQHRHVTIFQAKNDNEVTVEDTNYILKYFENNVAFSLLDTDHSFSKNRKDVFNTIIGALK